MTKPAEALCQMHKESKHLIFSAVPRLIT